MRIGIILTGDYGWAGGVYYSLNITKLLHSIADTKKLTVVAIVNSSTPAEIIRELPQKNIELSYLDKKSFFYRLYHKLTNDRFVADINRLNLDVLYPLISYQPIHKRLNCKVFYWLYDFQHKFLPQLFTDQEIKNRDNTFEKIATNVSDVVFSSEDSKSHFEQFYPRSRANKHVYHFVSLLETKNINTGKNNYPAKYFIVCNQFWPHKNHLVVLKSLCLLLKEDKETHVIFTGKYSDERNTVYVNDLQEFIRAHDLENNITLTGFLSREDQVKLITNSLAVIQPSFFEGWSTVVEDAKALGKFMITSNIPVNREQILDNVLFFDPKNEVELANCMTQVLEYKVKIAPLDYDRNIETSKQDLMKLFKI